jgi:hypothetical protein
LKLQNGWCNVLWFPSFKPRSVPKACNTPIPNYNGSSRIEELHICFTTRMIIPNPCLGGFFPKYQRPSNSQSPCKLVNVDDAEPPFSFDLQSCFQLTLYCAPKILSLAVPKKDVVAC